MAARQALETSTVRSRSGLIEIVNGKGVLVAIKAKRRTLGSVYLLQHVAREDTEDEDVKLLGIYTSKSKGESAIKRLAKLPGFKRYPKGFYLDRLILDEDMWTEGFVTRRGTAKPTGSGRAKRVR
jgi:hypothetical protein